MKTTFKYKYSINQYITIDKSAQENVNWWTTFLSTDKSQVWQKQEKRIEITQM